MQMRLRVSENSHRNLRMGTVIEWPLVRPRIRTNLINILSDCLNSYTIEHNVSHTKFGYDFLPLKIQVLNPVY